MGCTVSQSRVRLVSVEPKSNCTENDDDHYVLGDAILEQTVCSPSPLDIINTNETVENFCNEKVFANNTVSKKEDQTSSSPENLHVSQNDVQNEADNSKDCTSNEPAYLNDHYYIIQHFNAREEIVKDLNSDSSCQFDKRDAIIKEIEEYGTHSSRRSGGVVFYVPIDLPKKHSNKNKQRSFLKNKDITKVISRREATPDKSVPDKEDIPTFSINKNIQKNEESEKYNIEEKILIADILREEAILKRATVARQSQERLQRASTRRSEMETKCTEDSDNTELDQEIDSLGLRSNKPYIEEESNSMMEESNSDIENEDKAAESLDCEEYLAVEDTSQQANKETPVTHTSEQSTESSTILDFHPPSQYTMKELDARLIESRKCVSASVWELKKMAIDGNEYRQKKQEAIKSVMIYEQTKIEWKKRQRQMDRKKCPQEYGHAVKMSKSDIIVKTS